MRILMEQWMFPALVVIIAIWLIGGRMKENKNRGLAQSGADMERLKQAIARVLPQEESGYQVAYAHWEDVQHYGRSTRTTYYTYGVAFGNDKLWVVPLGYNKEEIRPSAPACFTSENTGVLDVEPRMKNETLTNLKLTLRDKNGANPTYLEFEPMNTRKDRFHHVNIAQQQECEQLLQFAQTLSGTVDQEHEGLKDRMQNDSILQSKKSSRTLGILGILFCWTCFVGLIFGGIGWLASPSPADTDGKPCAGRVLCIIATVLSVLSGIGFFVIISTW